MWFIILSPLSGLNLIQAVSSQIISLLLYMCLYDTYGSLQLSQPLCQHLFLTIVMINPLVLQCLWRDLKLLWSYCW